MWKENQYLRDADETNEQHIERLQNEVRNLKNIIAEREEKLREIQAEVYEQYKQMEALGQKYPDIASALQHTIPDGLWEQIFPQVAADRDKNGIASDINTGKSADTVPGANPAKQP